jgi:signal transduction histidine kinase
VHYLVRSFAIASVDRELAHRTQRLIDRPPPPRLGPDGMGPGPEGGPFGDGSPGERNGPVGPMPDAYRPRLFNREGRPFGPEDPTNVRAPWDPKGLAFAAKGEETYATVTWQGEPMRVMSRPFRGRSGDVGVAQAPYPLTEVYRAIGVLDGALLALIPVGLLCAGAGGFLLTNRVLRPLRQLTQTAERIGAEDLSARLPADGQDEFAEMGRTFNGMLSRLETAFREQQRLVEQQRRFTADASHELRTPLTVVKANADLCLTERATADECRQYAAEIKEAAQAMSHLVQDLLLLARSDGGRLARNRIALPVKEAAERAASSASRCGSATVRVEIDDPALCVWGNEDEIVRLLANLLENAMRHTPAGGIVTVRAEPQAKTVRITVSDTGEGIAPEHLPHLGERFYRVDKARSRPGGGSGLGLSICKSIVEAHGGIMTFESTVGKGTTVSLRLPMPDACAGPDAVRSE